MDYAELTLDNYEHYTSVHSYMDWSNVVAAASELESLSEQMEDGEDVDQGTIDTFNEQLEELKNALEQAIPTTEDLE